MLSHPNFDTVAIDLGFFQIHWYGITYLVAFLAGWWLARYRAARPGSGWKPEEIGDIVFYIVLGVVLGGKIGYTLFYNRAGFLENPLTALNLMQPGMSFHGGFIGVIVAFWLYARNTGRHFFTVADFIAPAFPIGLGAGRIGNFINGELWGRVTDVPWGMVFHHPMAGDLPRHPNPIYQFIGEGILLFTLIWWFSSKPRPRMAASGLFALAYGVYRFLIEFVREPDADIGFIAWDWLTMGQLLSLPMVIIGAIVMWLAYRKPVYDSTAGER